MESDLPEIICNKCGAIGVPKKVRPGSTILEVALWILFFFGGLIYSAYRELKTHLECTQCNSADVIGRDTLIGKLLTGKISLQELQRN